MTPVQQLMPAVASGAELFVPPLSYEWSLHSNDEGTYTNYAASNPPYGVMITFYQKEPQKDAPKLEILDRYGRVLRTVSGTHKVAGKDEPRILQQGRAQPVHVGFPNRRPREMDRRRERSVSRSERRARAFRRGCTPCG